MFGRAIDRLTLLTQATILEQTLGGFESDPLIKKTLPFEHEIDGYVACAIDYQPTGPEYVGYAGNRLMIISLSGKVVFERELVEPIRWLTFDPSEPDLYYITSKNCLMIYNRDSDQLISNSEYQNLGPITWYQSSFSMVAHHSGYDEILHFTLVEQNADRVIKLIDRSIIGYVHILGLAHDGHQLIVWGRRRGSGSYMIYRLVKQVQRVLEVNSVILSVATDPTTNRFYFFTEDGIHNQAGLLIFRSKYGSLGYQNLLDIGPKGEIVMRRCINNQSSSMMVV